MDANEQKVRQKCREKDELKKKKQRSRKWYRVRN